MVDIDVNYMKTGYSSFIEVDEQSKIDVSLESAEMIGTSLENLEEYPNWYLIDDNFYYLKRRKGIFSLINELLGEDLSNYMGLPTVHYQIVQDSDGNIIGLLSRDVKEKDVSYIRSAYLDMSELEKISDMLIDKDFDGDLNFKKDLTAYLVRNYFSALKDRESNSFIGMKDGNYVLAPIIDYELSFDEPYMMKYVDPLCTYLFTPCSTEGMRENNEYFQEYVELVLSYNYHDALVRIEKKHQIRIPFDVKQRYYEFDVERRIFMEDMGLKKTHK